MAEKNVKLPPEMEFQADTLRNLLREIQETKTDLEELAAISKNEAELNAAGKKPKQSIVKNQLALYKKELNNTKQEIERIKNALKLISEMREDYFASISAATKESKQISKVLMSLKETAETLPLWIGEDEEEAPALCGAIQTGEDYVAKPGDLVAAFVTVKHDLQEFKEWILAEVNDYDYEASEYKIQDVEKQNLTYMIKREKVIPLPIMRAHPTFNPNAIFPKGTKVLALYENTTCFYKGIVHEPPLTHTEPYLIAFEDSDFEEGFSCPVSVPQAYVLPCRSFPEED